MSNEFCEWCLYEETCKDRERVTKEYNMNKKKAEEGYENVKSKYK